MNYIITNIKTKESFMFEFHRNKESMRSFIANSASSRSKIELFRNVAQYGIENFRIENQNEISLSPIIDEQIIDRVEYEKLINGKSEQEINVEKIPEKKEKKKRKKRKSKKDVT